MKYLTIFIMLIASSVSFAHDYLGQYGVNSYLPNSTSNQYGSGSQYDPRSVSNPYGTYGSEYSNESANNEFAIEAPELYDREGNYRGKLSENRYDPESVSNTFGRFGSQFSAESINNEFGAGNKFDPDSPNNQFGYGLRVYGR